ncbi:MAG: hypothetical protein HMLKMBBP_00471 [Planctomycetes bacterium]|nr:hypothetical protein [Planctomycetota bacterium]
MGSEIPPFRSRFVRFAINVECIPARCLIGFFQATTHYDGRLRRRRIRERLREHDAWFEDFLPVPPVVKRRKDAICWFRRPNPAIRGGLAAEAVRRAFLRAALLRSRGLVVVTLETERPGDILYSDEMQVVAVPGPDTFTRATRR